MKTVVVVNGEQDWQGYLPGYEVRHCQLQSSKWLYHQRDIWLFNTDGTLRVDAVLWRVGAIRPRAEHRTILEMIRLAGIPCVNSVQTLLRGFDRLGMLNDLREAGLPVIEYSVALGDNLLEYIRPLLPAVVKIGNYHGGFGKARPQDEAAWAELAELAFISEDYVTVEPYIDYQRDIRCLAAGDQMWAMERRGAAWKANTRTTSHTLIDVPPVLGDYTRQAMRHLDADVLGLDFLQGPNGEYVLLESNDIPGFQGFPDVARQATANCLRKKLEKSRDNSSGLAP